MGTNLIKPKSCKPRGVADETGASVLVATLVLAFVAGILAVIAESFATNRNRLAVSISNKASANATLKGALTVVKDLFRIDCDASNPALYTYANCSNVTAGPGLPVVFPDPYIASSTDGSNGLTTRLIGWRAPQGASLWRFVDGLTLEVALPTMQRGLGFPQLTALFSEKFDAAAGRSALVGFPANERTTVKVLGFTRDGQNPLLIDGVRLSLDAAVGTEARKRTSGFFSAVRPTEHGVVRSGRSTIWADLPTNWNRESRIG